jgi:4-amino-4-deoxy-L-arabinose transferase-like glycosyltransferase
MQLQGAADDRRLVQTLGTKYTPLDMRGFGDDGPHGEGAALLGLALLAALCLATVLPNLANDPIVGGDEGWIISASAKLAEEGVFGSDLFSGFYGADRHYFFNLPLHHLTLAGVFKVTGAGVLEARLVSAAAGLLTLLLTYLIGRRLGGPLAGLAAAGLLVLLRLNLTPFSGLTLTDLGAIVRYDLAALPWALAALYAVITASPDPSLRRVALAGLLLGLAGLTQFLGGFYFLPIAAFLVTLRLRLTRRLLLCGVLALGAALPFLPYGVYAASNWEDFRGQARTVEQETDLLSPSFYFDNLRAEPDRYSLSTGLTGLPDGLRDAVKRPSARLTLYVLAPAAILLALRRWRSPERRLLALTLAGLALEFALLESTKRWVYWVAAVPPLCLLLADLGAAALAWRPAWRLLRLAPAAGIAGVALLLASEGLAVGVKDIAESGHAPDYAAFGAALRARLPADGVVMGDNRLWLPLREREFRSLLLLFYWTNPEIAKERTTTIAGAFERVGVDYLVLSPLSREILSKLTPAHQAEFSRYVGEREEVIAVVDDPVYGPVQVIRLRPRP